MLVVRFVFCLPIIFAASPLQKYRRYYEIETGERLDNDFYICDTKSCNVSKTVSQYKYVIINNEINNDTEIEDLKDNIFSTDCIVKAIIFNGSILIDNYNLDHCPHLKFIYFDGDKYNCKYEPWLEFIVQTKLKNISINSNISKNGTACVEPLSACENYSFLVHIICTDYMKYFKIEYSNETSIRNSNLPLDLQMKTSRLNFSSKNITDVTEWFEKILPKQKMNRLILNDNQLTAIPPIPYFPELNNILVHVYFKNNNITKFDVEALKTYLNYVDLVIALEGNPFICDCGTLEFIYFLRSHTKLIEDINIVMCKDASSGEIIRPWTFDYSKCKKSFWETLPKLKELDYYIIFMSFVTIVMIAIFWNVRLALNEVLAGNTDGRIPWIHHIWEFMKKFSQFVPGFNFKHNKY